MVLTKQILELAKQFKLQPELLRTNSKALASKYDMEVEQVKKARKHYIATKNLPIPKGEEIKHYWLKEKGITAFVKKEEEEGSKLDINKELAAFFQNYEPLTMDYNYIKFDQVEQGHALIISLSDLHLDKATFYEESKETSDIHSIKQKALEAITYLIMKAKLSYNIEKIIVIGGNDFFHANNAQGTTEKGTKLDVMGRYYSSFRQGMDLWTNILELCAQYCPTQMITVLGNHSPEREWYLAYALQRMYANTKGITVEAQAKGRKYFRYGNSAFMLQHDMEKMREKLPVLFITEEPELYASCKHRYCIGGHLHKESELSFVSKNESFGLIYKIMPSMSVTDKWHHDNAFIGNRKACVAMVVAFDGGEVANFTYVPK